ncbi:MAG: NTP transferase domain-containing protein [Nannocystis sp.]|nr:NTP transferase domain-containing protein [Nannocystis sp.]
MSNTAIILAAGMGSRLAANGDAESFSKPLIEVVGQSLLARTVAACRAAGADHILVVTGFRAELVEQEVERLSHGDLAVVFNPDWQRANGMSLLACRARIDGDRFALMMSDHIFDPTILADLFRLQPPPGSVTLAVDRKIQDVSTSTTPPKCAPRTATSWRSGSRSPITTRSTAGCSCARQPSSPPWRPWSRPAATPRYRRAWPRSARPVCSSRSRSATAGGKTSTPRTCCETPPSCWSVTPWPPRQQDE